MIHQRGRGRGRSEETIFGSPESELTLPKYRVPRYESKSEVILELIRDELFLDGNARQNLATFCQTYADDEVRQLMDLCIDKNIIDKGRVSPVDGDRVPVYPHAGKPLERPGVLPPGGHLHGGLLGGLHAGGPGHVLPVEAGTEAGG